MNQSPIEQAISQYEQLNELISTVEQAAQGRNVDGILALNSALNALQNEAEVNDKAVMATLRTDPALKDFPQTRQLFSLMQQVHQRNQRLTSHIQSIMAVQRNEMQTLRKGTTLLHGYKSTASETGLRISSAN